MKEGNVLSILDTSGKDCLLSQRIPLHSPTQPNPTVSPETPPRGGGRNPTLPYPTLSSRWAPAETLTNIGYNLQNMKGPPVNSFLLAFRGAIISKLYSRRSLARRFQFFTGLLQKSLPRNLNATAITPLSSIASAGEAVKSTLKLGGSK